jgi:alkaline phosphatase D
MKYLLIPFLFVLLATCQSVEITPKVSDLNVPLQVIAVGSCNNQDKEQLLWEPVISNRPDLFVWLGDNVYGDTRDMSILGKKYQKQKKNPDYQNLLRVTPVIGIWDDHDYGMNDGNRSFASKIQSKELMLDFLNEPAISDRRVREGAYTSYLYGPENQKVKIVILDTRYFKDELTVTKENRDMLGEEQWAWFENELNSEDYQLLLIVSSTQVIPENSSKEKWADYPSSRTRLFSIIDNKVTSPVLLLSGDMHFAELNKIELPTSHASLYEFTSSGLTHTKPAYSENPTREGYAVSELNFGLIRLDWSVKPVSVSIEIRGADNDLHLRKNLELPDLATIR